MRKPIVCAIIALFFAPLCAGAQDIQNTRITHNEGFAEPPRTEANHSVSIDLLGLHYAYEHPIGRTGTIIGRAGANFGAAWGSAWTGTSIEYASGYSYWMVSPSIEIEPRWYYGLDRRESKGRSSAGNSGSFLSLRVQNSFPGYVSDRDLRIVGTTVFSPTWGLRRVWGERWMFEFTVGYMVGFAHQARWWGDDYLIRSLDLNVRFGVAF